MGPDGEEVLELAHLVDPDLTARGFCLALPGLAFGRARLRQGLGLEDAEVGMVTLLEPETGRTSTARQIATGRPLAEEPPGEERRQDRLAEPGPAVDQQRMRQVFPPRLEAFPRRDQPRI